MSSYSQREEEGFYIFLMIAGGLFLLFHWIAICGKLCSPGGAGGRDTRARNTTRGVAARSNPRPVATTQTLHTLPSRETLASMYRGAFEETKNQAILEDSRIRPTPTSGTKDDRDEESQCIPCDDNDDDDDDDNAIIVRALESARSIRKAKKIKDDSTDKDDDDDDDGSVIGSKTRPSMTKSSSVIHPRLPVDHNRNDVYGNTVRGNCLICLEDLQPGEPVVWSMNEDCPHIFHKDCMVNFLSTKHRAMLERMVQLGRQPKEQSNPCPVCRIEFVTVPSLGASPRSSTTSRAPTTSTTPTPARFTPASRGDAWDFR